MDKIKIKCPYCNSENIKYFENISTTYIFKIDDRGFKKGKGRKLNSFTVIDGYGYTCRDCGFDFKLSNLKE